MKKVITLIATIATIFVAGCCTQQNATTQKKERKIAVQMWSLHKFTLEESLEKLKPLKLDAIECYPGQALSAKYPNAKVGYEMNAEERAYMKKLLKDAGVKMVSMGVANSKDRTGEEMEKICDFVKEMGADKIITETLVEFLPTFNKTAAKRGITLCVHHHTSKDVPYWNFEYFKNNAGNLSNVKYNPDPGHWVRSGIDPVEALKKAEGYIASVHIKDQCEFGNMKNLPAPLGEGVIDLKGILNELDRQGFDGYYVIEYETDWENNIPQITKCVKFLREN